MKCNVTRSGGAGSSEDTWELIETFQGSNAYVQTRTAEPDGTPYNFKAVMVVMKSTRKVYDEDKINGSGSGVFTEHDPTNATYGQFSNAQTTVDLAEATGEAYLTLTRTNGLLDSPIISETTYNNPAKLVDHLAFRASPITGVRIGFYNYSGTTTPTNVQFKIYAVRY